MIETRCSTLNCEVPDPEMQTEHAQEWTGEKTEGHSVALLRSDYFQQTWASFSVVSQKNTHTHTHSQSGIVFFPFFPEIATDTPISGVSFELIKPKLGACLHVGESFSIMLLFCSLI